MIGKKDKREEVYLKHILEAIELIPCHFKYLEENQKWYDNYTVQQAILKDLQEMSESCTRLSKDTQKSMPEIDWIGIRGFRNVLVHEYLGDINFKTVDNAIKNELPKLKIAITMVLKNKEKEQ